LLGGGATNKPTPISFFCCLKKVFIKKASFGSSVLWFPAFTASEVLLTIGLVGVVAAITLSTVVTNVKAYTKNQQFKKVYAILSSAVSKAQFDMGENIKCYYTVDGDEDHPDTNRWSECKMFYDELAKNFEIIRICEKNGLKNGCLPKDSYRGGDVVYAETQGGKNPSAAKNTFQKNCKGFTATYFETKAPVYLTGNDFLFIPYTSNINTAPIFIVDVNGHKGPNKWGHDVLIMTFLKPRPYDRVFTVVGSTRCHPLDEGGVYTKTLIDYLYGREFHY